MEEAVDLHSVWCNASRVDRLKGLLVLAFRHSEAKPIFSADQSLLAWELKSSLERIMTIGAYPDNCKGRLGTYYGVIRLNGASR